jgi:pyruvate-ferredoxin/flavodoxin oxidoreductase
MAKGLRDQKAVVDCGQWILYRYDPERLARGENPLQLDSPPARMKVLDYLLMENRFKMLTRTKPEDAKRYFEQAQRDAEARWQLYTYLAARKFPGNGGPAAPAPAPAPAPAAA